MKILTYFIIFIIFILLLYSPFKIGIDAGNRESPTPNKIPLGDSNNFLERPWGDIQNLKVFANLDNVSKKDRDYYVYDVLLALKWWENDKNHNLSYNVSFTMTNDSKEANIIFRWNDTLYGGKRVRGHAHINSSGEYVKTCDPYNPPFTQCSITILTNLSDEENIFVIKHELGHALGLRHSFNTSDFFILFFILYLGFDSNYLLSRSEIMFDNVLFNKIYMDIYKLIMIEAIGIVMIAFIIIVYRMKLINPKMIFRWK